jgi:hypothetical protein
VVTNLSPGDAYAKYGLNPLDRYYAAAHRNHLCRHRGDHGGPLHRLARHPRISAPGQAGVSCGLAGANRCIAGARLRD